MFGIPWIFWSTALLVALPWIAWFIVLVWALRSLSERREVRSRILGRLAQHVSPDENRTLHTVRP